MHYPALTDPFSGKESSYVHNQKLPTGEVLTNIKIFVIKGHLGEHGFTWQKERHTDYGYEKGGWCMTIKSASADAATDAVKTLMEKIGCKREYVSVFWTEREL